MEEGEKDGDDEDDEDESFDEAKVAGLRLDRDVKDAPAPVTAAIFGAATTLAILTCVKRE